MQWVTAIYAAVTVLVMGYPCALGMATPLALIRGGGMAAERGILMRSGEAFQILKDITHVVLDKTDRKSVVSGKSVSVRVDLGGRRIIKKKNIRHTRIHYKENYTKNS